MKSLKLRYAAALIAALTALPLFAACGENDTSGAPSDTAAISETETTAAETEADYLEIMGEADFEGSTFAMAGINTTTYRNFSDGEMNGEAVNDAIFSRDSHLRDSYNVVIETKSYASGEDGNLTNDMKNLVLAGDNPYSLVVGAAGSTLKTLATSAALSDIHSMPYIDTDNPWWASYASESLTIDDKLYFTTGDICPNFFYVPYVMCYNVGMAEDNGIDMYGMVMDGKWTNDRMREFTAQFTQDLDGDGNITTKDQIAYSHVRTTIVAWAHYIGSGLKLNTKDADGNIVVDLANSKSVDVIEKLQTIFTELENNFFTMDDSTPMFVNGQAFLFGNSMATVVQNFREMEDDYNFLPTPKYDEAQENYYTCVNTWTRGYVGIPKTIPDPERDGFIIEAMAYLSYRDLRPAAYDVVIGSKLSRTEEAADMLDIIYGNIYIDANYVFDFGGSATTVKTAVMDGQPFMSSYEAVAPKIDAAVASVIESME